MDSDALELPQVTWEGFVLGLVVLVGGWLLSRLARATVRRVLTWRGRSASAARVFAMLVGWAVVVVAVVAALTVVFPSVRPVNALGGLGVLSIAAGIAFQTVLGNMFAGIVLLARDVYRAGDQIAVREVAGTVTAINLTSTVVQTFDGRLVLIPNNLVHSEIVTVQTGYEHVRSTVAVDLDDRTDLALAVRTAEAAMGEVGEVLAEPAPQALLQEVGSGAIRMDLRFWSGARQMETKIAQHHVIGAVLAALDEAGVATGSDVLVLQERGDRPPA